MQIVNTPPHAVHTNQGQHVSFRVCPPRRQEVIGGGGGAWVMRGWAVGVCRG